eukprot:gene3740-4662_t
MDIFFVGGDHFLLTLTKLMEHLMFTLLSSRKTSELFEATKNHTAEYRGAGFDVTNLQFDGEGGLAACTRDFKEILHLQVNATGPEQHVGAIEVKFKRVKERIRDNFTILPMPDHVVAHLNDLAARDKRPIQPDAAIALGNLENNVINNDVRPVEDAYLDPAVEVPREGATVQRADATASVSEKGYVQQTDESKQAEAGDGQLIQPDDLPTDDIVELKEDLPETEDYRDEGNNVDAEKSNRPEDVPNEVKDLPLPMDDPAEQQPKGPYGLRSRANLKKPARYTVNMGRATRYYGFNMSVKKALATYKEEGFRVLVDELQQMINKGVMHPVRTCDLSSEQYKVIIRSSTFVKAKYKPDGSFDKLKARLVAGGNMQDRSMYEAKDISSPTVKQESVMMIAAIAAQEKRNVVTVDITGDYLNADMS